MPFLLRLPLHTYRLPRLSSLGMLLIMVPLIQAGGCFRREIAPPPPGGAYLSTSAGASFDQTVAIEGSEGEHIASFSLQAAHRPAHIPNRVYIAAAESGYVVSENGGETWQHITTPLTSTLDVIELPNGAIVTSGVGPEGQGFVLRSLDGGASWETVLTVPVPEQRRRFQIVGRRRVVASIVLAIESDPFNRDRLYAGSNLGTIFLGEQSGKIWRTFNTLTSPGFQAVPDQQKLGVKKIVPSLHTRDEILVVTAEGILLRVREGQQSEIVIPKDLSSPVPKIIGPRQKRIVSDVLFVPGFPDALFAGVEDGAVISRNAGQTWEELSLPVETVEQFNSLVVAVSPTNISRLLIAVNDVVYRSEDGGKTWNTFTLSLPNYIISALLIDPTNASRVLAVTRPIRT